MDMKTKQFDRTVEDVGNIIGLEHVNVTHADQAPTTLFWVLAMGGTRDPYLMTELDNMWINVGRSQFHLPTQPPQVLRGHTGLVLPDRTPSPALLDTKHHYSPVGLEVGEGRFGSSEVRLRTPVVAER